MNDLLVQLQQVSGLAEGFIWQAALVFIRVGALVALWPALGEQMLPLRIRLAAAIALTMVAAPVVAEGATLPTGLFAPIATEAAAGLVLGIGLRLLVLGLQTAGTIIAQSTSLAQMFGGTGGEPQPVISNLLIMAGLAAFVAMGGLARAAELVILSYGLLPQAGSIAAGEAAEVGLRQVSAAFALAFSISAPFVLATLIYNLAMGAINRAMPMLMVSMIGAPALTLGGLALLAVAAPMLLSVWTAAVGAALSQPFGP